MITKQYCTKTSKLFLNKEKQNFTSNLHGNIEEHSTEIEIDSYSSANLIHTFCTENKSYFFSLDVSMSSHMRKVKDIYNIMAYQSIDSVLV